jgi:hypothetical protein
MHQIDILLFVTLLQLETRVIIAEELFLLFLTKNVEECFVGGCGLRKNLESCLDFELKEQVIRKCKGGAAGNLS